MLRASQVKSLHHGSLPASASRTRYLPADHVASVEVGPTGRACSAGWERTFQTGTDESHESDVGPHDRRSVVHVPRVENPLSGGPPWTIRGRHASVDAPLRREVREPGHPHQRNRSYRREMSSGDGQLDHLGLDHDHIAQGPTTARVLRRQTDCGRTQGD